MCEKLNKYERINKGNLPHKKILVIRWDKNVYVSF